MKASVMRRFGDFDVLEYEEIDTPTPRPGHVLVKVLAAGVNRLDHYIREGSVVPDLSFPQDAPEAHRLTATNQVAGNLVLLPWAA